MSIDAEIVIFLNGLVTSSPFLSGLTVFCATYLPWVMGVAFVFLLYRSLHIQHKLFALAVVLGSVTFARLGVGELIRAVIHRPRPYLSHDVVQPLFTVSEWSFPSGHALFMFAFATAVYFFDKRWGGWMFAGSVVMVLSRIGAGVHYPSDIIVGAVLGAAVAYFVYWLFGRTPIKRYLRM